MKKIDSIDQKFVNQINEEVSQLNAPILIDQIKSRYLNESFNQKKSLRIRPLAFSLLSLVLIVTFSSIYFLSLVFRPIPIEEPFLNVLIPDSTQQKQLIAFESISGVNLLDSLNLNLDLNSTRFLLKKSPKSELTNQLPIINKHMSIIEQLLNQTNPFTINVLEPTNNYQFLLNVTANNIFDEEYEYLILYNEKPKSEKLSNDLFKEETIIEGELIIGEDSYSLLGSKEIITNDFKIQAIQIKLQVRADDNNWIEIYQEKESDSYQYVYDRYVNGIKHKSKIKVKNDAKKGFYATLQIDNIKYDFKQVKKNNQVCIQMSSNKNKNITMIFYDESMSQYCYQTDNLESEFLNKEVKGQKKKNNNGNKN